MEVSLKYQNADYARIFRKIDIDFVGKKIFLQSKINIIFH